MKLKTIAIVALALMLVAGFVLTRPCTVVNIVPQLDENGSIYYDMKGHLVDGPVFIETQLWAKILWDMGFDLYYTPETGISMPGNF